MRSILASVIASTLALIPSIAAGQNAAQGEEAARDLLRKVAANYRAIDSFAATQTMSPDIEVKGTLYSLHTLNDEHGGEAIHLITSQGVTRFRYGESEPVD